jgi:hypothetical protein
LSVSDAVTGLTLERHGEYEGILDGDDAPPQQFRSSGRERRREQQPPHRP